MKGVTFYLEYPNKTAKKNSTKKDNYPNNSGNVIAVFSDDEGNRFYLPDNQSVECACGLWERPNSPVCGSSVSLEYLSERCKRISEAVAKQIHPKMFAYLNS